MAEDIKEDKKEEIVVPEKFAQRNRRYESC
jgi:hypothetical protein